MVRIRIYAYLISEWDFLYFFGAHERWDCDFFGQLPFLIALWLKYEGWFFKIDKGSIRPPWFRFLWIFWFEVFVIDMSILCQKSFLRTFFDFFRFLFKRLQRHRSERTFMKSLGFKTQLKAFWIVSEFKILPYVEDPKSKISLFLSMQEKLWNLVNIDLTWYLKPPKTLN